MFKQFLQRMRRGPEETGIFKILFKKPSWRLENKCSFNNVGTEPKTAKLPLGMKTLNCIPGWITKQTVFLFSYLPYNKQSKMHHEKILHLGFKAICWHWKSEMGWLIGLVNYFFIVLMNKISWSQVMRKSVAASWMISFSFQKIPPSF